MVVDAIFNAIRIPNKKETLFSAYISILRLCGCENSGAVEQLWGQQARDLFGWTVLLCCLVTCSALLHTGLHHSTLVCTTLHWSASLCSGRHLQCFSQGDSLHFFMKKASSILGPEGKVVHKDPDP